jgi:hypothetical protein
MLNLPSFPSFSSSSQRQGPQISRNAIEAPLPPSHPHHPSIPCCPFRLAPHSHSLLERVKSDFRAGDQAVPLPQPEPERCQPGRAGLRAERRDLLERLEGAEREDEGEQDQLGLSTLPLRTMLTTVFCYFHLQKEIEVLLNEIFLPILEMRTSTIKQKSVILNVFLRLSQDPQALVEIYLNYDCDRTAIENIYERLVEIIAKIGSTHFAGGKEGDVGAGGVGRNEGGRAGAADKGPVIPPSLTTSAMGGAGSSSDPLGGRREAWAHLSPEVKLRRQSLECLVTVLRSLVQWGTAGPRGSASTAAHMGGVDESHPRASEDVGREGGAAVGMENGSSAEGRTGASSPTIGTEEDDPERFESAKQRKNALMEGIKKFNFKPKRVSRGFLLYPPHLHADCLATVCSSLVLGRVSNLSSKTGSSEAARQTTSPSSSLLPKA